MQPGLISLLSLYVVLHVICVICDESSAERSIRTIPHGRRRHRSREPANVASSDTRGRVPRSGRRTRRQRTGSRRRSATTEAPQTVTEEPLMLDFHTGQPDVSTERPVCGRDCMFTRDLRRHHRLEAIKEDILHKLKLDGPVNITNRPYVLPRVPQIDLMVESMMQGDQPQHQHPFNIDDDDYEGDRATTLRVYNFAETPPANLSINDSQACFFRFSNDILGSRSQVQNATLGVYIKSPFIPHNMVTYILIYSIGPPTPGMSREQLIHKKKITLNTEQTRRWYEFDLTRHVNDWIRWPNSNYGIKIIASDSQGTPLAVVTPQSSAEVPYKPYLELSLRDNSRRRTKRRLRLDCDEHSNETRCCRYPLEIDFNSFHWDFIIAPKRYSAYYCAGECPFVYFQKYPHTHVFENAKPKDAGGPCCSPDTMSPLRMLYFDQDLQIKIDTLPGMVVERCSCES